MNTYLGVSFCAVLSLSLFSRPPLANLHSTNITFVRTYDKESCHINFITIDGKLFLVKQKKKIAASALLSSVREALAAYVAEIFPHLAHKVDIIPAGKTMPGKIVTEYPASLHTIAPGKEVRSLENAYGTMDIRQKEVGFNRAMLRDMAKHPQLVTIVALDTFLCNGGRHRANIFYDEKDDSFCAIDMESSFRYTLGDLACNNFSNSMIVLTDEEIKTLSQYKKVLELLIKTYDFNTLIKQYYYFLKQAGIVENSSLCTKKVQSSIHHNISIIKQSYYDTQKLIKILTALIKKSASRQK